LDEIRQPAKQHAVSGNITEIEFQYGGRLFYLSHELTYVVDEIWFADRY